MTRTTLWRCDKQREKVQVICRHRGQIIMIKGQYRIVPYCA